MQYMETYDELIQKINELFNKNELSPLSSNLSSSITKIMETALSRVWEKEKQESSRNLLFQSILNLAKNYDDNITRFIKDLIFQLNFRYPPEENYIDSYLNSLSKYNDCIQTFLQTEHLEISIYAEIVEKLLNLIKKDKNNIIRYINIHNSDFHPLVVHGLNSTIIVLIGAIGSKMDDQKLKNLGLSCLLHDIGMFRIPEEIINKTTALTEEEYTTIKTHTGIAYKILNKLGNLDKEIIDGAVQHHEQFDGNGYPKKLKNEEISEFAKFISIADSFDAQISRRSYRKAKNGYLAMKEVIYDANSRFDPDVLKIFLLSMSIYPPGTLVQLNDYSIGLVDSPHNDSPLRPSLRLIIDHNGNKVKNKTLLNLKDHPSLFIAQVLNKEDYQKKTPSSKNEK